MTGYHVWKRSLKGLFGGRLTVSLALLAASPSFASGPNTSAPCVSADSMACAEGCGEGCGEACSVYDSLFEGGLCSQTHLLGDMCGLRDGAASSGYTFDLSSTQFYQGVTSGGVDRGFEYGGRNDYILNVNGEQAGLWKGFFVSLHGETRYGDTLLTQTGALMPPNLALLLPATNGTETALTGVKLIQGLSEEFIVFGGKLNTLDDLIQPFAGGRGVDAFMNTGLAIPVSVARTVPYSTLGAGFATLQGSEPILSVMVLDTNNTPTTSGFESFFNNGATVLGKLNVPVTLFDKPGHQGILATYSSGTYNDLSPTAYFDPDAGLVIVPPGTDTGSWSLTYSADQALYVDPCNENRRFGVFTNIGLADNGPSPVRWSANVGLGGSSPVSSRPLDTFGIGYSHVEYSDPVQNLAPILLPIGNDDAVELFYNIAVTPWFRVTPDIQFLMPARERTLPPGATDIDTAVVFGLRGKVEF